MNVKIRGIEMSTKIIIMVWYLLVEVIYLQQTNCKLEYTGLLPYHVENVKCHIVFQVPVYPSQHSTRSYPAWPNTGDILQNNSKIR